MKVSPDCETKSADSTLSSVLVVAAFETHGCPAIIAISCLTKIEFDTAFWFYDGSVAARSWAHLEMLVLSDKNLIFQIASQVYISVAESLHVLIFKLLIAAVLHARKLYRHFFPDSSEGFLF